ncbi:MAG: N-formylglutamate amidohydrolase [Chthoniobacteraceae bacterium]
MSKSPTRDRAAVRWRITSEEAGLPLVAVALHDGHEVRASALPYLALDEMGRLREEDPFTAEWVGVAPHQVVVSASRFEVDLNRDREGAVYRTPDEAWGLTVWRDETPDSVWEESLALHDRFYGEVATLLDGLVARHGRFVLFDLHTYNHRREGRGGPVADPARNPEVNLGTGSLNRGHWRAVIDRFLQDLRSFNFAGRHLDVRENVRFRGGAFSRWVAARYPTGCPLAIEVKKFFMNEWAGEADRAQVALVGAALASTVPGVLASLAET